MRVWKDAPLRGLAKYIVSLTITLFSLICGNQAVFADDGISISLSPNSVNLNVLPGNYGSADQTVTVSTTNPTGYEVMLEITGSSTSLVEISDSTLTIPTFALSSGQTSIPVADLGYGYDYSISIGRSYGPHLGHSH